MEKQIISAAVMYLYSWSSDQNLVELNVKMKRMFLQSTHTQKILKTSSTTGLKKKLYGNICLRKRTFQN